MCLLHILYCIFFSSFLKRFRLQKNCLKPESAPLDHHTYGNNIATAEQLMYLSVWET